MTLSRSIGALTRTLAAPFLLAGLLSGGVGCERETRDTDIKLITIGETKSLWDKQQRGDREGVILVDPRPEKDYSASHIGGARSLRLPQVDPKGLRDPALERFGTIVVYGDDPGSASARGMVKRMMAVGYDGVRWFAGGLKEWKSRGYPTVDAPVPPAATAPAPESAPPPAPEPPSNPK